MTLYNKPYGKGYTLNTKGESYVLNHWETLSHKELSNITGVGIRAIARFLNHKGCYKNKVKEKEQNDIVNLLGPYDGKITCSDACRILKNHNITFNWHKVNDALIQSGFKFLYDTGMKRVFIDGNKNNLKEENIILLTSKEYQYLCNIGNISNMKDDVLLSCIELAKLRLATNDIEEVYVAKNLKTGQVIKENNKTLISKRLTKRHSQYDDCKSIGENGERFIRDWIVTREIRKGDLRCQTKHLKS